LPLFDPFFSSLSEEESYRKEEGGSLRFFAVFRKRWGLFLGFFLFFLALFCSTFFIWGVEITGNTEIPSEIIREKLGQAGLLPGKKISSIDPDAFSLLFQIQNPEFSFVNLNFIGTKAVVEIREREVVPNSESKESATNLVSKIWGTVVRVEVYSGQSEVKKGDTVTEGTLLISGVRENKNGSFSAVRAEGRVFAETERIFEVFVPFEEKKSVFTGKEKTKKIYEILGFHFPFWGTDSAPFEHYKTVETVESMAFFGLEMPIRIRERNFLEIKEKNECLELDRARKLAYDKYDEFIRETLTSDAQILEEKSEITEQENGVFLSVEMRLVENICKEIPFRCTVVTLPE
jgi:similar to stage IV sporulation protein